MALSEGKMAGDAARQAADPGLIKRTWGKATHAVGYAFGRSGVAKPLKFAGVAAVVATAVAGVALWAGNRRSEKARESRDELHQQKMDSMRAEMATMQPQVGANTLMGLEPTPGDRAARVMAARNGGMGLDASNPPVSMPYEAVR